MNAQLTEIMRLITNLIRTGIVTEVDRQKWLCRVKVSGFKQPIDDAEWTITTLTHTVSPDNGFTTGLDLEVKIDEFEIE